MIAPKKPHTTAKHVGSRRVAGLPSFGFVTQDACRVADQDAIARFEDRLKNGERLQDYSLMVEEIKSKKAEIFRLDNVIQSMDDLNDPEAEAIAIKQESLYKEISDLNTKEAAVKDFVECAKSAEAALARCTVTERKFGRYRSLLRLARVSRHVQMILRDAQPIVAKALAIEQEEHRKSDEDIDIGKYGTCDYVRAKKKESREGRMSQQPSAMIQTVNLSLHPRSKLTNQKRDIAEGSDDEENKKVRPRAKDNKVTPP